MQQVVFMGIIQIPFNTEAAARGHTEAVARVVSRLFGYQNVQVGVLPVAAPIQQPPSEEASPVEDVPPNEE